MLITGNGLLNRILQLLDEVWKNHRACFRCQEERSWNGNALNHVVLMSRG